MRHHFQTRIKARSSFVDPSEPRNLIAAQGGTAPEVLSRSLHRPEDDGILGAAPHHVIIHDPDSLRSLAEMIE
jgi:hypothetical protein